MRGCLSGLDAEVQFPLHRCRRFPTHTHGERSDWVVKVDCQTDWRLSTAVYLVNPACEGAGYVVPAWWVGLGNSFQVATHPMTGEDGRDRSAGSKPGQARGTARRDGNPPVFAGFWPHLIAPRARRQFASWLP